MHASEIQKAYRPPMSPHSLNTSIHTPLDALSVAQTSLKTFEFAPSGTTRSCSRCNKPIPMEKRFKMCEICRAKNRQRQVEAAERKRARLAMSTDVGGIGKESLEETTDRLKREFANAQMKGKMKSDIPAKPMNVDSDGSVGQKKRHANLLDPDATEYQTSNALYAALSATAADSNNRGVPIAFAGCYVIISTARPSISIKHRVGIVASELRTKLRLCKGHRGIDRHAPLEKIDDVLSSTHTFSCRCSSLVSTASASASSSKSAPMVYKNMASGITHYFGASDPVSDPGQSKPSCGGTVKVTVDDDFSHPYGIRGHSITVEIKH